MALCLKNVKFLENDNENCSKDLPKISLELFGKSESIPFDSMEQLKKFLKTPNLKSGIKNGPSKWETAQKIWNQILVNDIKTFWEGIL